MPTPSKSGFFDSKAVMDALAPGERKALSKFGAFVRQKARSSIRKRKAVSPAGQPPSSHTNVLKKAILFAYDSARLSVVVGPTPIGSGGRGAQVLEEGGDEVVMRHGKPRLCHYRGNPYMKPAFNAELEKINGNFRNLIK